MPSFPQPGSVTICEINRDFITAESLSDDRAKETYAKAIGHVFSPIPFRLDDFMPDLEPAAASEQEQDGDVTRSGFVAALKERVSESLKRVLFPNVLNLTTEVDRHGVSWHPHKHILAFISGQNQVTVRDCEDSEGKDPCILTCESQRDITTLEWRPNSGKMLSIASRGGICIWSASYPGQGTPIQHGLGAISMLKWSPSGDYFLTAKYDGTFYLWETNTWTSEPWSSSGGYVTGATWDPEGRMVLLAFSDSVTLGSIHFSSRFPSLDAHLLPVELPEIASLTSSHGIEKVAWDASGERLALAYKGGDEVYSGLIAVYDVRRTPLISLSLVGFIRGPGEKPKPLTFAFHNKFKQGPLLSVCWSSGICCTYPLIFRSHVLP